MIITGPRFWCSLMYRELTELRKTAGMIRILCIAAVTLLFFHPGAAFSEEIDPFLPMRLRPVMVHEFDPNIRKDYFIVDVDNDRDDDLLLEGINGVVWFRIKDKQLSTIDEGQFKAAGKIVGIHDVTGDGVPEFFYNVPTPEGNVIYCHDWFSKTGSKQPLYVLGPYHKPLERDNNYGEGSIAVADCRDIDGDGRIEVYLFFNTYQRDPYPRSLRVFDGPTGTELHRYDMGPNLAYLSFIEDPQHGSRIVLSTFASDNGAVWNGTADSLSYIFCFHPDLELDWRRTVAGKAAWCNTAVGDIDGDGVTDIIVARTFGDKELASIDTDNTWSVRRLDPLEGGKTVRECALYTGTEYPLLADLDRDGRQEILIVGENAHLYILDHELNVLERIDGRLHDKIHHVVDLDRDGSKEIVCSGAGVLMIYDCNADLKTETPISMIKPVDEIITATAEGSIYLAAVNNRFLNFYAHERNPISAQISRYLRIFWMFKSGVAVLLIVGMAVGATLIWVLLRSRLRRPRADEDSGVPIEANEDLLSAMTAFGHGGASLRIINRLRFYLTNWERAMKGGDEPKRTFNDLVSSYSDTILPELKRIASMAKRAGVDRQRLGDMLDSAKTAEGLLPKIGAPRAGSDESGSVRTIALEALDALDRCIAAIREYLRAVFRCPVATLVIRAVAERREELDRLGIEPTVTYGGAEKEHAFLAPHVLEKIMDNLILNAVRAMADDPDADLGIAITSESDYVRIDVSDTGCGISEDDREKIFDRGYSTKQDGGFGLHYASEQLARFGGKIFVFDSSPGAGTTMRIILKRS